jgi:hypothetical protein
LGYGSDALYLSDAPGWLDGELNTEK